MDYCENFKLLLQLFFVYKMLNKIAYLYWSKLLKIDENDKNAEVNIFQGIIDTIVIVFVGCCTPLGPLLTQIS